MCVCVFIAQTFICSKYEPKSKQNELMYTYSKDADWTSDPLVIFFFFFFVSGNWTNVNTELNFPTDIAKVHNSLLVTRSLNKSNFYFMIFLDNIA